MAARSAMMIDSLDWRADNLPKDCGYNKVYKHEWVTYQHGLLMHKIPAIHNMCTGRWGWYFKPQEDMDYGSEEWYEKQTLVLCFENKWDLIHVKLTIDINK